MPNADPFPSVRIAPQGSEPDDALALATSRRLADRIRAEAEARGGTLPFDRFMELALYAPGLGYYVAGAQKFGPGGDFQTAPAISPLFGACLARQAQEVLAALGGGEILELGAGGGELAVDILAGLNDQACLPRRYVILEPGTELRERQRALIAARHPPLLDLVHWVTEVPQDFAGMVIANEVMDAFPVHRFQVLGPGRLGEVLVGYGDQGWTECLGEPCPALASTVEALWDRGLALAAGYASEVNLRLGPWIAMLAARLQAGLLVLIDYGYVQDDYYRPERDMGTLMCHYRHQAHGNPYPHLGLQDITAHVDFTAAAWAGHEAGLELAGFTTQAHFLIALGLEELLADALAGQARRGDEGLEWLLGARQLVLPEAMGERFRVLGLSKGTDQTWRGFTLRDLRGRL